MNVHSQSTRLEILNRMAEDALAGRLQPVASYQAAFSSCPDVVAEEYRVFAEFLAKEPEPATVRPASAALEDPAERPRLDRFAHFEDLVEIGRGGQGIVYHARDRMLGRPVALKLVTGLGLGSASLARFLREAEIASRLHHPSICTIYESGVERGMPFIAMQFVEGDTLGNHIAAWFDRADLATGDSRGGAVAGAAAAAAAAIEPGLPAPTTAAGITALIEFFVRAARALAHAHECGIVHRDIKPGNLVVQPDGRPILLDFGLARDLDHGAPTLTVSGAMLGTPAYMSPEQIGGEDAAAIDHRTDVYSLGVTLYEAVTGRQPFTGATVETLCESVRAARAMPPRKINALVSRDLEVVIQTAMERDPARRYQSAADLADDLQRILDIEPIRARPISRWLRVRRWSRRNPLVAASLVLAFAALGGGLVSSLLSLDVARRQRLAYERLAIDLRFDELLAEVDATLWSINGDTTRLEDWLLRARRSADLLPALRAELDALRAQGTSGADRDTLPGRAADDDARTAVLERARVIRSELAAAQAAGEAGLRASWSAAQAVVDDELAALDERRAASWHFDTTEDQWRHDRLAQLVARIEAFVDVDATGASLAAIEQRLETWHAADRALTANRESWRIASERLRADARFAGFELTPMRDLVPLGADPDSGLLEFALFDTGAIPVRGADGRLPVDEDTAIVLVLIPGGTVELGPVDGDHPRSANETRWSACLVPYLLGKYEVTQAQWARIVSGHPSTHGPGGSQPLVDLSNPVEGVSWHEADGFARRLGCELPTEAQWERASRAGRAHVYTWGDDEALAREHANLADLGLSVATDPVPWNDGHVVHAPVGSFAPNAFGLHDMAGNVHEWCRDEYAVVRLPSHEPGDALQVHERSNAHVVRGASWYNGVQWARTSWRMYYAATTKLMVLGLRVARTLRGP